jgi:hypothetical protein
MYKVLFADGSEFSGGDIFESRWNEMPDKPIASLQYSLFGVSLALRGFEAYNHVLENVIFLNRPRRIGKAGHTITRIILMGTWQGRIYEVIYDVIKTKVFQKSELFTKKYSGWKIGTFDPDCLPTIRQIRG